ncbi:MAG: hypothetical protein AAFP19_22880, partial [Bacteroidota bacterium]
YRFFFMLFDLMKRKNVYLLLFNVFGLILVWPTIEGGLPTQATTANRHFQRPKAQSSATPRTGLTLQRFTNDPYFRRFFYIKDAAVPKFHKIFSRKNHSYCLDD